MPKKKGNSKKTKRDGGARGEGGRVNEEDLSTPDNGSVCSSVASDWTVNDEGATEALPSGEVDEVAGLEDFEEKVKDCIDGLTQKSVNGRCTCLKGLQAAFSKKFMFDFVLDRKLTITDAIERCLKKGKGEEVSLAARASILVCIQLGAGEGGEEIFKMLKPLLLKLMLDNSVALKARAACAEALGILCFVASAEFEQVQEVMKSLNDVFKASYLKGDGVAPSHSPEVTALHAAALSAWCLLLTICPPSAVANLIDGHLSKVPMLLQSSDVDLRVVAGETLALMYEMARDEDEDFEGGDIDELCEFLKKLATESAKRIAKKDRRQQRSTFRDVLRSIEDYDAPEETIKFGTESLEIYSWVRKLRYNALCNALSSGMNTHLQENDLIRDIFDLGAPIPAGLPAASKMTHFEKHMYNSAAFKARTKARSKQRDKRSAVVGSNGL